MGVNSATGSTGVDVNNRSKLGSGFQCFRKVGIAFCVMIFFRTRSGYFRRPFNGYKRLLTEHFNFDL